MKKTIAIFIGILLLSQVSLNAQAFQKGDMVGNLGFGFGWYSYGYGVSSLPAISVSLEKGVTELGDAGPLAIGGILAFKHATYLSDWTWNDVVIAARGSIHPDLFKVDKLDTYAGVALGVRIASSTTTFFGQKEKVSSTGGLFGLYVGGRYYFSDKFGAFAEAGYGLGYLTLGLSYKFN